MMLMKLMIIFNLAIGVSLGSFEFSCNKDTIVTSNYNQSYFIKQLPSKSKFTCLAECEKAQVCSSITYKAVNGECNLYNSSVNSSFVLSSPLTNLCSIKCKKGFKSSKILF